MKKYFIAFTVSVSVFIASSAFAITIDFRDNVWEGAEGLGSFTYGDVTLSANPQDAVLWQDGIDGIGIINGYENDEIEGSEVLQVSFASEVILEAIYLADFFYECRWWSGCYSEIGYYSLNGADWTQVTALNPSNSNGEMSIVVGEIVSSLWLRAPGRIGGKDHEFALQRLDITPVPEPATLMLMGIGLAGLAGGAARRKWKKKALDKG